MLDEARATDDGYLLELLTESAIIWEYAISRSPVINGMSDTARIVRVTPWWQTALEYAAWTFGVLTALCAVMLLLSRKNRDSGRPGRGQWFSLAAALLGIAALAVYAWYVISGGENSYYVICATLLAVACMWAGWRWKLDAPGIAAAALLAFALAVSLGGGIGNITDAIQGIVMFGNSALANLNYAMAALYGGSVVAATCACFSKK